VGGGAGSGVDQGFEVEILVHKDATATARGAVERAGAVSMKAEVRVVPKPL
jgi:hypothetical protein